ALVLHRLWLIKRFSGAVRAGGERRVDSLAPFLRGEGWGEGLSPRPLNSRRHRARPLTRRRRYAPPPTSPRKGAGRGEERIRQAATPAPIGHDTPVPPRPQ